MRTGVATFTLDTGHCPPWLFERMVRLGRVISTAIISEFGSEEFIRRLADPVWFQSLGTLMAFDWNASGLTVVTMAALKEALRGLEKDADVFITGGKGKTSKKTPDQITQWSQILRLDQKEKDKMVYTSKAVAKVDSALIQDGFQLYHHNFIFNSQGYWVVVQQGMNTTLGRARRYHWLGSKVTSYIEEPHSAISSAVRLPQVLDLTNKLSQQNNQISLELVNNKKSLYRELKTLEEKKSGYQFKILDLPGIEFNDHPVNHEEFLSPQLNKAISNAITAQPKTYEQLLMTPGVGPKTIRALSLVGEVIYGAKPSYDDPARYSFGFGGKDGTPYPVDRKTYDQSLGILEHAILTARLPFEEKETTLRKIDNLQQKLI